MSTGLRLHKITNFLKRTESFRQGFVISTILNMFSKVIGFLATILTAFFFGSSTETDFFFFSMGTMGLLSGFLINLDSTKIIPEYMKLRAEGKKDQANNLFSFIFMSFFLITATISILIILNPMEWMSIFSKFDHTTISSHLTIIRWAAPFFIITTLNSLLIDVLASFKRFSLSIATGFVSNIISIILILFFHKSLGVKSVLIGGLFGGVVQGGILVYLVSRLSGCNFWPNKNPIDKKFIRYVSFSQGAYLFSIAGAFFPLYLLTGFSTGMISALGYSQRLIDLLSFILITQFSNVFAIKLNDLHIKHAFEQHPDFFVRTGKAALFFSIPIITIVSVLSFECISVIFLRGEFHRQEAMDAARFASVFVFLIPFLIINVMVARLTMASHKIDKSFIFQLLMGILAGASCYIGIHFFGAIGYPYSQIAFYAINLLSVNFLLTRWFPWLRNYYSIFLFGIAVFAINCIIIPLDILVKKSTVLWHPISIIVIIGLLHIIIFGIIAYSLKIYKPLREFFEGAFNQKLAILIRKN
jgi:putative peptidoglycan lipid II flippase